MADGCPHHWLLDEPLVDGRVFGWCRACGEERLFVPPQFDDENVSIETALEGAAQRPRWWYPRGQEPIVEVNEI